MVKRAHEALARDDAPSILRQSAPEAITSRTIAEAAAAGDALADRLMRETARYLAVGAVSMMHTIDPDLVLFGGGMINAGDPLLDEIRRNVRTMAFPIPAAKTRIEFAQLGDEAGFVGAAGWARKILSSSFLTLVGRLGAVGRLGGVGRLGAIGRLGSNGRLGRVALLLRLRLLGGRLRLRGRQELRLGQEAVAIAIEQIEPRLRPGELLAGNLAVSILVHRLESLDGLLLRLLGERRGGPAGPPGIPRPRACRCGWRHRS